MKSELKIDEHGNRFWKNEEEQLHRLDGPAIEEANGRKCWMINGKYHRTNGPAIEYGDGNKYWGINGVLCSEKEYQELIQEYTI